MTTKNLPDALLRRFGDFILAGVLAALLGACGPGSGGTGTGPIGTLVFSGVAAPGPGMPGPGTGAVSACQGSDVGAAELQGQEGAVLLVTACGRFVASTGIAPDATLQVLPGRFESASGNVAASLRLQFNAAPASSSQVTATIEDASGRPLLGPVALQRNAN